MASIKAIKNHIIFQFEDEIVRKTDTGRDRLQFAESTNWGFEVSSYDEGTKVPRWGTVKSVGHEVKSDIAVGSRILIEALAWTEALVFNGEPIWRTDESKVLAVDEGYKP